MYLTTVGFPRIDENRGLEQWVEDYLSGGLGQAELAKNCALLRKRNWALQKEAGITLIPSNDFTCYDNMLDMAFLLNAIPKSHARLGLSALDTYFAMARGYEGPNGTAQALPMKKWFNTNYHYTVPLIEKDMEFKINGSKPFDEYAEALKCGIRTKPVLIGPFTFLKLSMVSRDADAKSLAKKLALVYADILERCSGIGAEYVQFDEPALVMDLSEADIEQFRELYTPILLKKGNTKAILQTCFGDIRDVYTTAVSMNFDAIGLDFTEGEKNPECVRLYGFPKDKLLIAGVVNGKNVWKNHYAHTLKLIFKIMKATGSGQLALGTSCSLQHVPYSAGNEPDIPEAYKKHLCFATEKLQELRELHDIISRKSTAKELITGNILLHKERLSLPGVVNETIRDRVAALKNGDMKRTPGIEQRAIIQKRKVGRGELPAIAIGSFLQMEEIKHLRRAFGEGKITEGEYEKAVRGQMERAVRLQEKNGPDLSARCEFERSGMVEYFAENLDGFLITQNDWVQSYGISCARPPVVFGDIERKAPIIADCIAYARGLTENPIKGMLTGPVTLLNGSYPRDDLPVGETAFQIALAIRGEVLDLESRGIGMIQIDEAAFKERLPLRKSCWGRQYLDWATKASRLAHSGVRPETQIYTHMYYCEFADIRKSIDELDSDVVLFRSR